MLNGNMFITTDMEIVKNSVYDNCKVVALVENAESINTTDMSNISPASILLPPFQAVSAEVDGNMDMFYGLYYQHLATKEADGFISLMVAALVRGINILLYVPKEEAGLSFTGAFLTYLLNTYGVTVGTEQVQCGYNRAFDSFICTRLYMHELISYQEFFVSYPADVNLDPNIIPQLMFDMKGMYPIMSGPEEHYTYFNDYKNRIKQNGNRFLTKLMVRSTGV